jgi:hypothetical protein
VSSFVVVAPTGATATDANAIDDAVNTRMTLTDRRRMISFYPIFRAELCRVVTCRSLDDRARSGDPVLGTGGFGLSPASTGSECAGA